MAEVAVADVISCRGGGKSNTAQSGAFLVKAGGCSIRV